MSVGTAPAEKRHAPPHWREDGLVGCEPATRQADAFGHLPRAPRYYSLDAWRGAACLAVVLYHSSLYYLSNATVDDFSTRVLRIFAYGWLGVPVFFVISGYCISATADNSRRRSRAISDYFVRRFRRIYPPYWVFILLAVLIVAAVDVLMMPRLLSSQPWPQLRPWWFSPSQWFGNLTLTESWRHHVFGSQRAHFVGQSWTLCYEEQFYAVVGLLLWLSAQRFFLAALLGTLAVGVAQYAAHLSNVDVSGFFFDGSWLMFAAGILVYFHVNYAKPATRVATYLALLGGILICALSQFPMIRGGGFAFAFAMLLLFLHPWDAQIKRIKWFAPLIICGTMCYSLYLVHELVVRVVQRGLWASGLTSGAETLLVIVPLCTAASLAAGWGFYVLVERRFLNPRLAT